MLQWHTQYLFQGPLMDIGTDIRPANSYILKECYLYSYKDCSLVLDCRLNLVKVWLGQQCEHPDWECRLMMSIYYYSIRKFRYCGITSPCQGLRTTSERIEVPLCVISSKHKAPVRLCRKYSRYLQITVFALTLFTLFF